MNMETETDVIEMIADSARGAVDRRDLSRVRDLRYAAPGFDRHLWQEMCELGWPALRVHPDRGGVGLGMAAYCALAQELGAALAPEPLIEASLSAALLGDDVLTDHLSGAILVLPAWQDAPDASGPSVDLTEQDGGVSGVKHHVPMAQGADAFLAIGPDSGWMVDAGSAGVALEPVQTQDGGHAATLRLDGAAARRVEVDPRPALAEACLATSAYLVGLTEEALARTVEFLGVRKQFGVTIGSFQALQHQAVDLKLLLELARASMLDAAARWDREPASTSAYAAVARAKASACNAALRVTKGAIQLHGGIGFTDEHDIGLYLRKAMVVAPRFGSARLQRALYRNLTPEIRHD